MLEVYPTSSEGYQLEVKEEGKGVAVGVVGGITFTGVLISP